MKMYTKVCLGMLLFILMPVMAHGATRAQLLTQIEQLTQIVVSLQSILERQQQLAPGLNLILPDNLEEGDYGQDVSRLQTFLRTTGDFVFPQITLYYGRYTREAVERYQCRMDIICGGTASSTGYGEVGVITRATLAGRVLHESGLTTTAISSVQNKPPVTLQNDSDATADESLENYEDYVGEVMDNAMNLHNNVRGF